ncbi:hypothetical protein GCM10027275_12640 [Rhabdobacter roseus]|uniref:Lipopolysaccharide export system permease protein n=1 Tax=Rhabdobacter roseus TaxID=1655419 RepID=A0A840TT46_9BACT|nr:LptF/LptG family permease [Rhabdobacter roseus]MBB5283180.1 lipopolysaccharide export system permease protein [Rhabdobacter roseus]
MKKLDKLVIQSFWGPFVVTLSVVVFIFLMRIMIFYIDDFVSKDLGLSEYSRLFFYFSLSTIPIALPLAMLLSSLMAFGNLGEFFELTAIKSAGISVVRAMRPLFIIAVFVSVFSFFFNDRVVPWANLKGYSLLYDIKTTKATLKIKEGIFYNDLPGYSIKVDKKLPDGRTMKGMVIYKHDSRSYERGNTQIILADSGRIYSIHDNTYLVIELFDGSNYQEMVEGFDNRQPVYPAASGNSALSAKFVRNEFQNYKLVESLESFGMKSTDEEQFKYHEFMKNIDALNQAADSIRKDVDQAQKNLIPNSQQYYSYTFKSEADYGNRLTPGKWVDSLLRRPVVDSVRKEIITNALSSANSVASFATTNKEYLSNKNKERSRYELQKQHKYTEALSCLIMFLIGAPLGAIIKKGGFGVPVLVSIVFFILMYVLTIQGDKFVKEGLVGVLFGAWLANGVLFMAGMYFIDRARNDSRLFEKDSYQVFIKKMRDRIQARRQSKKAQSLMAEEMEI